MAALSLALGLSVVVQQRAGGIKLDVIFIDEGFGSLVDQTLDNALSTLRELVGNNRAVSVISHVDMVKQQYKPGSLFHADPAGAGLPNERFNNRS
jgi:exonuclease SbcC